MSILRAIKAQLGLSITPAEVYGFPGYFVTEEGDVPVGGLYNSSDTVKVRVT